MPRPLSNLHVGHHQMLVKSEIILSAFEFMMAHLLMQEPC
jgi:hypothetical protein